MRNLRRTALLLICMLLLAVLTTTASAQQPKILDCSSGTIYAAAGETVTVFVEADQYGRTFAWQAINDYTLPNNDSRYASTYTFTMTPELDGAYIHCKVSFDRWYYKYSSGVWINLPLLLINEDPEGGELVTGMKAKTSIEATGDRITYQWYCSYESFEDEDFTPIPCTGPEMSMTLTKPGWYLFHCEVTDASGQKRKSYDCRFDVYEPVYFDTEPSDTEATLGNNVRFYAEAIGCDVSYQWYYKDANSNDFTPLANGNSFYITLPMNYETNGAQVYCVATDAAGNTARTSIATAKTDSSIHIRGDCEFCGGDGRCNNCGGRGRYDKTVIVNGKHESVDVWCDGAFCGSGSCTACGGDGWTGKKKTPGDADDNGTVNTRDILLILQYTAGWDVTIDERTANVDYSPYVDTNDAVRLLLNLAGN